MENPGEITEYLYLFRLRVFRFGMPAGFCHFYKKFPAQIVRSSPVEIGGEYVMTEQLQPITNSYYTQERIKGDLDYSRAQTIAKMMLDNGLISVAECNKLIAINRETFSPLFAEIMPKIT